MPSPLASAGGRLPLAYLSTAAAAFVAAAVTVPWLAPELAGHYYHPRVLALTHLVTLGWITLTIMGASYQLVPVLLGQPLWSERLAWTQLGLTVAGMLGMVGHFFFGAWSGLAWAAGLVGLGVVAHVVNVGLSLRGLRRWTFTAVMIVFALGGVALTTLAGVALALDHLQPFLPWPFFPRLHAHFHLALLGWVLPMVLGVSDRAYAMFLLAPRSDRRLVVVQLLGLVAGAPLVVLGVVGHPTWLTIGGFGIAAATAAHLYGVAGMARSPRRPQLDWALRMLLTGAAFLGPASLVGLAFTLGLIEGPRFGLAYVALALGGWASLTIAGMMLKIVPFLVWYRVYASRAGREAVPTIAQLTWPAGGAWTYALLVVGVLALSVALYQGDAPSIRAAGLVLAAGALAFAATLARVLRHDVSAWL